MAKYLYTIQIPFENIDDIGARQKISEINQKLSFYAHQPESKIKLQALKDGEQPRKVQI